MNKAKCLEIVERVKKKHNSYQMQKESLEKLRMWIEERDNFTYKEISEFIYSLCSSKMGGAYAYMNIALESAKKQIFDIRRQE